MSVSVEDVLKHVVPGAALALLFYTTGVITDAFVFITRFDISFQRTSILDKSGYLFQFKNTTGGILEGVTLTIAHHQGFDAVSSDNGVKIQIDRSNDAASFKLDSLPSNKIVNIFLVTPNQIQINDIGVVYKNTPYRTNDANYVNYSWLSPPLIFNVLATFAMYVLGSTYLTSKLNVLRKDVADNKADADKIRERSEDLISDIKNIRSEHVRIKAVLFRRMNLLSQEVEMWRRFFDVIYKSVFSSSKGSASETAMKAIMNKLGIHHVSGVRDLSENEFLQLLYDAEPQRHNLYNRKRDNAR